MGPRTCLALARCPGSTSCLQKLERRPAPELRAIKITVETDYCQIVLLRSQVLISIVEVQVEALRHRYQPLHVFGAQACQTNGPFNEDVLHESPKRLKTVKPAKHDSDGMKSEIGNEEAICWRLLQEPAYVFRPRLIEESLQPNVGVYKIHQLVTPPFQRPLLKLQGGILVPIVAESACPVLTQLSPGLLLSLLDQELREVPYLLSEIRWQLPDQVLYAFHGSLQSPVLPQNSAHGTSGALAAGLTCSERTITSCRMIAHS